MARPASGVLWTLGFGLILTAVAFVGGGGLDLGPATTVEIGLDLGGGVLIVGAIVAGRERRATFGSAAIWLFAALAVLTTFSVLWSVQPADSWLEANRTLAYAMTFVSGVVLAREAPGRWTALIGGLALSCIAICCWALVTKVFPGALAHDEIYARLRAPYSYWNATGLTAALGILPCLWLGARRHGHAAVNALGIPALGILVVTLLLAYSRGSLLALGVGLVLWFWLVPLRLRGAAVLAIGGGAGLAVSLWVFSQSALSDDNLTVPVRAMGGHRLGVVLVVMSAVLYCAALLVNFVAARHSLDAVTRRRAGVVLLCLVALAPIALAGKMATSSRGLGGSISYDVDQLTNPHSTLPANDASRLTALGSVRARYWNDALKLFKAHPAKGVGAGGFATARPQVREDDLHVEHAHGYIVQTLADLGFIGLAVSLALFAAWLVATMRTVGRARRGTASPTPERAGMLTLLGIVVVFGVHSAIDWTWFIPGNAVPALLCAGWLAGRGPLPARPLPDPRPRAPLATRLREGIREPIPAARAALVAILILAMAWAAWQPLLSQNSGDSALAQAQDGNFSAARSTAEHAIDQNPLSIDAIYDLALIDEIAGAPSRARSDYQRAVQLQPSNPATWLQLAEFELRRNHPQTALADLGPALYLDPRSPQGIATFLQATAATQQASG